MVCEKKWSRKGEEVPTKKKKKKKKKKKNIAKV